MTVEGTAAIGNKEGWQSMDDARGSSFWRTSAIPKERKFRMNAGGAHGKEMIGRKRRGVLAANTAAGRQFARPRRVPQGNAALSFLETWLNQMLDTR